MEASTGAEIQACGFVGAGADVTGADDGMAVRGGKVEKRWFGDVSRTAEFVETVDCGKHSLTEDLMTEAVRWSCSWVDTDSGKGVQEERECPFAICASFHNEEEPLFDI